MIEIRKLSQVFGSVFIRCSERRVVARHVLRPCRFRLLLQLLSFPPGPSSLFVLVPQFVTKGSLLLLF